MIKILKYAKKYWYYIVFAVIFLFMQAGSELILPQYTSSIVNNGIQFGGIENAAVTYWGKENADNAKIFMTDEEKAVFDECYSLENVNSFKDEVYVLKVGISKEKMTSLENILEETAAVVSTEEGKKTDISSLTAQEAKEIRNNDISMLSASSSSNVKNTAITYVKAMYENIGVDVNSIQMNYLKNKGIVMALLAFVAMLASAAGGFCA